jgi:hypothetical protein
MMLLELFAYTADNLSYMQDRVANEAFLGTATQRRSVAGHLQLLGYRTDEGAAAHTWLQFQVLDVHTLTTDFKVSNQPKTTVEPVVVFEPLAEVRLDPRHNAIALYTWGNVDCCLPPTALSAALDGNFPDLKAGDYLLIEDDKARRDVIRLTASPQIADAPFASSPPGNKITVLQWSAATPLHFDYCAAEVTVRGNMVGATHGETATESINVPPAGSRRLRVALSGSPPRRRRRQARLRNQRSAASAPFSCSSRTQRGSSGQVCSTVHRMPWCTGLKLMMPARQQSSSAREGAGRPVSNSG